jgi:hypothetical protein
MTKLSQLESITHHHMNGIVFQITSQIKDLDAMTILGLVETEERT